MNDYRIQRPPDKSEITWKVIYPMGEGVDFYEDLATFESTVSGATKGQRAVFAYRWYVIEVENGGHHQFFWNSTGMLWEDALDGFRTLHESAFEDVLRAASSLFPNRQPSKVRQTRQRQLEDINKASLSEMDDRLYNVLESHDLETILENYINSHPEEFFFDP